MSKVVKIPKCASPFVVHINGKKHIYPAGEQCEVPDEVAVIVEAHNKAHIPEFAPTEAPFNPGGSGGNTPIPTDDHINALIDAKLANFLNVSEVGM